MLFFFYFTQKRMYKNTFVLLWILLATITGHSQKQWTLKVNKQDISVYTKTQDNSDLKAIKVECVLNTTLSGMVAVIMDVNAGAGWVYSTKSSVLLKQVSPSELYYYSEVSLPWPISNRDFIAHLKAAQDPVTKTVIINGPTIDNYVPVKENIVRVKKSSGRWVLKPYNANHIKVEYVLETDPGGSLPAWMVNLFVTKGPFETFKKLKEELKKPAYANIKLPYIVD